MKVVKPPLPAASLFKFFPPLKAEDGEEDAFFFSPPFLG